MICKNCGYDSNMSYCPNCGAKLEKPTEEKLREIKPVVETPIVEGTKAEDKKGMSKNQQILLAIIACFIVVLLIVGVSSNKSCNPATRNEKNSSSSNTPLENDIEYDDYSICGLSLSAPSDWSFKKSESNEENTSYFYPDTNKTTMFMVSKGDEKFDFDFNLNEDYIIDSALEGFFSSDEFSNVKELSRKKITIDGNIAVRLDCSYKLEGKSIFSSIYFTIYNSELYSFVFTSEGKKANEVFSETQDYIIDSIVFDEVEPTIEYTEISTKKLYNNSEDYDGEYITTTLKITNIDKEDGIYTYKVYDLDGYDEVEISASYWPEEKVKKGDYITVSGYCSVEDDYYDGLYITISQVEQSKKVKKSLFKKIGGSEKKPKPIPQEYLNALEKAKSYSELLHMSKKGLYDQLTSEYGEGFPADAAQYAIDNLDADYNYNALEKAKSYYNDMNMSKQSVYEQLISEYGEQFTASEAQYAVDHLDD